MGNIKHWKCAVRKDKKGIRHDDDHDGIPRMRFSFSSGDKFQCRRRHNHIFIIIFHSSESQSVFFQTHQKAIFLYRTLLYRFSKLVMFCGKCEADNELRFITNLSSSSAHPSDISQHRETSSKVIMSSFFMLAGWKTRIDPGDWHSSWEHRSNSIWLVYERDKFILPQDLLLDYRFKMGR